MKDNLLSKKGSAFYLIYGLFFLLVLGTLFIVFNQITQDRIRPVLETPELNFSVEGHTDSDGNDATNQTLSENRAKTVMNQLITLGIDKSRLKSQGFGESKPVNDNTSAEGKAQNRRVEFVKF